MYVHICERYNFTFTLFWEVNMKLHMMERVIDIYITSCLLTFGKFLESCIYFPKQSKGEVTYNLSLWPSYVTSHLLPKTIKCEVIALARNFTKTSQN